MNFFCSSSAAKRYAQGRPYFHPLVIQRTREFLSITEPLHRALDLGCGTGLSAIALTEIAGAVVGVDASREMLALAPRFPGLAYVVSAAESLPFATNCFDLITMSQVFHWLDRRRFFAEARRTLTMRGMLISYDNYFSRETTENRDFQVWLREEFLVRYPSPQWASASIILEEAEGEGFNVLGHERLENEISFSIAGLVNYLLSQSNVIAKVESGSENIADVRSWMIENVRSFFADQQEAMFVFSAPVWFLQRAR